MAASIHEGVTGKYLSSCLKTILKIHRIQKKVFSTYWTIGKMATGPPRPPPKKKENKARPTVLISLSCYNNKPQTE